MPTPMGGSLPRWRKGRAWARQVAYPNGRSPAPTGDRTRMGVPSCLPQWEVTCPYRAMHATAALDLDAFLLRGFRTALSRAPFVLGAHSDRCFPLPALPRAPSWSKMRLGFAVFGGPSTRVVQNASQFDGFGRIHAISGRLRRILDHAPGKTPNPPETQTHFGPPSSSTTGPPVRASRLQSLTRATVPEDHGHRAAGRLAATTCPPTPQKSRTAPQPRTRRAFPLPSLSRHWR